jgi:methyl-accepting chemotaxis protein
MFGLLRTFVNALTIQTKITISLVLVVVVCFAGSLWMQVRSTRAQMISITVEDARLKTTLLSNAINSGVAAHDRGTIERVMGLSNDARNHIATAVVLHIDGASLVNFQHGSWPLFSLAGQDAELLKIAAVGEPLVKETASDILVVTPIRNQGNRIIGVLATAWDLTQQNHAISNLATKQFIASGIIGLLLLLALNYSLWALAVAPLRATVGVMDRLSGGRIDGEIPYQSRADEIGRMAAALCVFQANAQSIRHLEGERVAQEEKAAAWKRQAVGELINRFRTSVQNSVDTFSNSSDRMIGNARVMAELLGETRAESDAALGGANDALEQCQMVARAASQAANAIAEIGRRAEDASHVTQMAVDSTRKTDQSMQSLQLAAARVGDVVGLINKIAAQTNMLALNATIEAARAGEMGKGFAVVATEVKQLAHQTSRATAEISGQVMAIRQATQEAVTAIAAVNKWINQIGETATEIAVAVDEHTAVASEVASSIDRVVNTSTEVTRRVRNVSSVADKNGEAADDVLRMAENFSDKSKELSSEVEGFLTSLEQD